MDQDVLLFVLLFVDVDCFGVSSRRSPAFEGWTLQRLHFAALDAFRKPQALQIQDCLDVWVEG